MTTTASSSCSIGKETLDTPRSDLGRSALTHRRRARADYECRWWREARDGARIDARGVPYADAGGVASMTTSRRRARSVVTVTMALKEEPEGSRGNGFTGRNGPSWDLGLEIEVPFEQRPSAFHFLFLITTARQ
ncbi:hypothetical protein GUJ93_ZPchr0009g1804 [Zizania palustris]|uniref:Uncharacterized protein n=1 Tax=Zizania palustris TaxID=103762 RepID=A0A8J5V2G2_ZIZPA|nr:hypothetical protein GUJ93_ZPchr0009g1804 [Zizania palustris]